MKVLAALNLPLLFNPLIDYAAKRKLKREVSGDLVLQKPMLYDEEKDRLSISNKKRKKEREILD